MNVVAIFNPAVVRWIELRKLLVGDFEFSHPMSEREKKLLVFFGIAGLSADLTILGDPKIAMLTAALILIASIGKFSSASRMATFTMLAVICCVSPLYE